MQIDSRDVLLVIDVQNDFCPDGALPVPHGDEVIAPIHRIAPRFEHIVLTQDWHPADHSSFAASHPGKQPYDSIELAYGTQTLLASALRSSGTHRHRISTLVLVSAQAELILRKGFRPNIDSYSAFFENDHSTPTGLAGYLRERGFARVFLAGLAYDYCVGYSALDARRLGFPAFVFARRLPRHRPQKGSVASMDADFAKAGSRSLI